MKYLRCSNHNIPTLRTSKSLCWIQTEWNSPASNWEPYRGIITVSINRTHNWNFEACHLVEIDYCEHNRRHTFPNDLRDECSDRWVLAFGGSPSIRHFGWVTRCYLKLHRSSNWYIDKSGIVKPMRSTAIAVYNKHLFDTGSYSLQSSLSINGWGNICVAQFYTATKQNVKQWIPFNTKVVQ